jgi:predicted DCC family thiol-disulfide oxidoreductase YuxK
MRRLFVLYDASCGLCTDLRRWASRQPSFLNLEFVAAGTPRARRLFPSLDQLATPEELVAVTDEGAVYRDSDAWILCLYALREYRAWALRLARPALRPLARQAFRLFSRNRRRLSRLLDRESENEVAERLRAEGPATCACPDRVSEGSK